MDYIPTLQFVSCSFHLPLCGCLIFLVPSLAIDLIHWMFRVSWWEHCSKSTCKNGRTALWLHKMAIFFPFRQGYWAFCLQWVSSSCRLNATHRLDRMGKIDREISGILRSFSVSLRSWRLPPNNTVTETSVRGSCLAFESVWNHEKKSYISYINIKNINCSNVVFHRKIAFIWDQASDPHILCYACYASCMHGSARLLTRLRHVTSSPCIFGIFGVGGCYAASLCQGWFQLFSSFPACTTSSSSLARTMNLCRWVMVRVRLRKSGRNEYKWIKKTCTGDLQWHSHCDQLMLIGLVIDSVCS